MKYEKLNNLLKDNIWPYKKSLVSSIKSVNIFKIKRILLNQKLKIINHNKIELEVNYINLNKKMKI